MVLSRHTIEILGLLFVTIGVLQLTMTFIFSMIELIKKMVRRCRDKKKRKNARIE